MRLRRCFVLIFLPVALALHWDGPQPTQGTDYDDVENGGWSPAPMMEPGAIFEDYELRKRQSPSATNATCGFIDGSTSNPYTCFHATATCALDTVHSVFGCCPTPTLCQMPTACVPQSQLATCDNSCVADPYLVRCDVLYPYCNQWVLSTGTVLATAWFCDDIPYIDTLVLTATDGSQNSVPYDAVVMLIQPTTVPSTSTSAVPATTITYTPAGGSQTQQAATPTSTQTSTRSSAPVGAIVGGTLGGIALLAAIVFGVWWFRRDMRMNSSSTAAQAYGPSMGGQTQHMENRPPAANTAGLRATSYRQQPSAEKEFTMQLPPHSPDPHYPAQAVQQPQILYPQCASEVEGDRSGISPSAGPGNY